MGTERAKSARSIGPQEKPSCARSFRGRRPAVKASYQRISGESAGLGAVNRKRRICLAGSPTAIVSEAISSA